MASRARNRGADVYSGNSTEIPGCDSVITIAAAGTTRSEAYFVENAKTFLSVSRSFWLSSLEKAGKSMVVMGEAKNMIRTEKVVAIP